MKTYTGIKSFDNDSLLLGDLQMFAGRVSCVYFLSSS